MSIKETIRTNGRKSRSDHHDHQRRPPPQHTTTTTTNTTTIIITILLPLYIYYRIYMVQYIPIMDCDEIYNYWEPLHYILYQTGFQTWEYHYEYALRTYTYLLPLQILAASIDTTTDNKAMLFLTLRQFIAAGTACCELFFLYALWQYYDRYDRYEQYPLYHNQPQTDHRPTTTTTTTTTFNPNSNEHTTTNTMIPYCTGILLLTCTGMNHSVSALLPSATFISIWCLCTGCFLLHYHTGFIVVAIIGTLTTGWPFGCICIVPMALHIVYQQVIRYQRPYTLLWTMILTTIVVQGIVTYIDTIQYGTITFPTWNIFRYNAGQSHDSLYGIEPLSYYIKNLLLNCNGMAILGCLAIPVYLLLSTTSTSSSSTTSSNMARYDANLVSILLSLPIWFLITLPRPHKEERFMYPIYPVLIYGSVVTIDLLLSYVLAWIWNSNTQQQSTLSPSRSSLQSTNANQTMFRRWKAFGHVCIWIPIIAVSSSRTYALYKYYHAPIDVYNHLSTIITKTTVAAKERQGSTIQPNVSTGSSDMVCTCGEWYRYMSSFYLPEGGTVQIPMGFLPSSFKGQLPQPFTPHGSKYESLKYVQPFNDQNEEVTERYVNDIRQCQYLVDVSDSDDCRAQFMTIPNIQVIPLYSVPFLDTDRTGSILHRILYIPYVHEQAHRNGHVVYMNYTLYRIEMK